MLDEEGYAVDPTYWATPKKEVGDEGEDEILIDEEVVETKPLSEQLGIETIDVEADIDTVKTWAQPEIIKTGEEVNKLTAGIDNFAYGTSSHEINREAKELNKFLGNPVESEVKGDLVYRAIKYKDLQKISKIIENDKIKLNKLWKQYVERKEYGIKENDPRLKEIEAKILKTIDRKKYIMHRSWQGGKGDPSEYLERNSHIFKYYKKALNKLDVLKSKHKELSKKYNKDLKNAKLKTEN